MTKLITYWKTHPKFRVFARTVGVAVAGYLAASWYTGVTDWHAVGAGAITAAINAIFGFFGLEPSVGLNKPKSLVSNIPTTTHK